MSRITTTVVTALTIVLLATACGGDGGSDPAASPSTTVTTEAPATTEATETPTPTEAPATTAAPETTEAPATTEAPDSTEAPESTEAPAATEAPATTVASDTDAPAAPTGLVCQAGGGSGEVTLSWDAPADPADIATVQIYLREGGGSFSRIHTYTQDELLDAAAPTWVANVFPVPFGEPFELAVTYDDAAENESGWNPIDAWSPFAGGPCEQGAPDTPVINGAFRGAGSLEVTLDVSVTATDVVEWAAQIDQGVGFGAVGVVAIEDRGAGDYFVTIAPTDWSLPATYRLVAIDAHGLSSGAAERACPVPISPGDVAC